MNIDENKISKYILFILGLSLFILSLWAINNELRHYHPSDILKSLLDIPKLRLVLAIIATILGYLIITLYDYLAFLYLGCYLKLKRIIFTAFISYAISNTVGFAILTGGALRYRFYSYWGISPGIIAKVIAFGNLTFWLGLFTIGGVVFLIEPLTVPEILKIPFVSVHPIGLIFLVIVSIYLIACFRHQRSLKIGKQVLSLPSLQISLAQIAISLIDWGLAVAVLYLLLPSHIHLSYIGFTGIYLLGMTAGIISNVPGGLGVFETVIILMLQPQLSTPEILGSLLAYRGIYYLLPLFTATSLLASYEIKQKIAKST